MSDGNGRHHVRLASATYPNPQAQADVQVPLGWCNTCIGTARLAEDKSPADVPPIRAAVTLIPQVVRVDVPGAGKQTIVAALPACWEHTGHSDPDPPA